MTTPATPAATGAGAGLWIKLAVNVGRRKVTYRVVTDVLERLPSAEGMPHAVKRAAAVGFLAMLWAGIAEHTTDGVIAHLPDALLEDWAGWTSDGLERGAFARWIRASHLADDGKVRDWDEFAGALQTKRSSDAERKREQRRRDREEREAREAEAAAAAAIATARANGAHVRLVDATPERQTDFVVSAVARDLTIAANKGMHDNPAIGEQFNPIVSTRADGLAVVEELAADGVTDWLLLARIVYTIAKQYTPDKPGDQIRALTFFKSRALTTYLRELERVAAAASSAPGDVELSTRAAASSNGKRARTGAGALAAADSFGLSD